MEPRYVRNNVTDERDSDGGVFFVPILPPLAHQYLVLGSQTELGERRVSAVGMIDYRWYLDGEGERADHTVAKLFQSSLLGYLEEGHSTLILRTG